MFTWQVVLVAFSNERNSLKPPPTRPSAKYYCLFTGPGGGGVPVGVGVSVGLGDGVGLDTGVVGDEQGAGFVAIPGSASSRLSPNSSLIQILLLPSTARPSWWCELPVTQHHI